jgi:hypothetical protein
MRLGHALCCSPRLARHVPEGVVRQCVNARSRLMRAGPESGGYRARRSPRHPVYVRAVLHAHGTCHRIHIVDYSQHGFRLERVSGHRTSRARDRRTAARPTAPDARALGQGGQGGCALPRPYRARTHGHAMARSVREQAQAAPLVVRERVRPRTCWELSRGKGRLPFASTSSRTAARLDLPQQPYSPDVLVGASILKSGVVSTVSPLG